jgi:hypothetical protein
MNHANGSVNYLRLLHLANGALALVVAAILLA